MNKIVEVVNKDKELMNEIDYLLQEFDCQNDATKLAVAKEALIKEAKYKKALEMTIAMGISSEKELVEKERLIAEAEHKYEEARFKLNEYREKFGVINSSYMEKRKLTELASIEDGDKEAAQRYINKMLSKMGIPKNTKIYVKRGS